MLRHTNDQKQRPTVQTSGLCSGHYLGTTRVLFATNPIFISDGEIYWWVTGMLSSTFASSHRMNFDATTVGWNLELEIHRRKFRSQISDNMDRWKAEQGRGRKKRKIRREKRRRKRVRRKKMQMREKVGKSRDTVFFQWFVAPEGRKVGSLKRRVRSQLARWEMNKCTPLWREAHFQVKMYKTHQGGTTFGSWDVEKVHAVVARSTFVSEKVINTSRSDRFWKLRCRKSARRCGAKRISKSKCTKHTRVGPLLLVEMSKKWTWLRREAHLEVSPLLLRAFKPAVCPQAFVVRAFKPAVCLHSPLLLRAFKPAVCQPCNP